MLHKYPLEIPNIKHLARDQELIVMKQSRCLYDTSL